MKPDDKLLFLLGLCHFYVNVNKNVSDIGCYDNKIVSMNFISRWQCCKSTKWFYTLLFYSLMP